MSERDSENDNDTLRQILRQSRTIAVVGLSADSTRPSHGVATYLRQQGYRIIPVNPRYDEVLGERCYPDLAAIPEPVDMVDVFRNAADCVPIAEQAVAIGAKVLWLQLGVVNDEAARIARAGGLTVVQDRCVEIEHARLAASI